MANEWNITNEEIMENTADAFAGEGKGVNNENKIVPIVNKGNPAESAVTYTQPGALNTQTTGVYIACIATRAGVTKVVNETALNADVTGSFTKQTSVDVEGANDYTAAPYNVWHYIPAVSYAQAARLKVTLG